MKYKIKYSDKSFNHKNDFLAFIKENKATFERMRKEEFKDHSNKVFEHSIDKAIMMPIAPQIDVKSDHIEVVAVINTTNLIDSHLDLHLPNMWNKNLQEQPNKIQLQEHQMKFDNLLDDNVKAEVKEYKFSELGFGNSMKTQALLHTFNFKRSDNAKMFDRYVNGQVKEHSVGMRYVKMSLAYDDQEDEKEQNYFSENKMKAANPEVADEYGFFWVIQEAKDIEGSAVVKGSNFVTPTLIVRDYEPSKGTPNKAEPIIITPQKPQFYSHLI